MKLKLRYYNPTPARCFTAHQEGYAMLVIKLGIPVCPVSCFTVCISTFMSNEVSSINQAIGDKVSFDRDKS